MPTSLQLAADDPALLDAVKRCRKLLNKRALVGAAAGAVPVPGLDWLVDAALLSKLLPAISEEFGLTPEQLDRLPKRKQEQVQKAVSVVGSMLIGRFIGMRMTVGRAAKYVPLAGQAVSAVISYTAIRYLGEEHIKDCVEVCKQAHLVPLPGPDAPAAPASTE